MRWFLKMKLAAGVFATLLSSPSAGQQLSVNGEITGFTPVQGSIVKKKIAGSASGSECGQWLRSKNLRQGINSQGRADEKTLAIGVAPVSAALSSPDYIDSRYVAFREAWLVANGSMARALESQVKSSASRVLITGQSNRPELSPTERARSYRQQAARVSTAEGKGQEGLVGAFNNGARLLNAYLSDELKKRGHDLDAERKARNESNEAKRKQLLAKAAAAEAEAKRLVGSRGFKEILEAVANERMKGIYTRFTNENLDADGGKTQMCVILQYSRRSESLADMMASRDFSNAPTLEPDIPLIRQLPDPSTPKGVFKLINKWGLTVLIDENGHVNLVAYGQAGFVNGDENSESSAMGEAKQRAEGLIRLFINQTVSVQEASKLGQNVRTFIDNVKKVSLTKSRRSVVEQKGNFRPINGMRQLLGWSGVHPVTNRGIAGSVVVWNASEASGSLAAKKRQNNEVQDTGGILRSQNQGGNLEKQTPSVRKGGFGGSTRSRDF